MRWGVAWLVPLVLLPGCDSGAPSRPAAKETVNTEGEVSAVVVGDVSGERFTTGDTSGRAAPWSHARLLDDHTLLLWSTYCGSPEGAKAVLSGDMVAVTVYWPPQLGASDGRPGAACSPEATLQRMELPEPVAGRLVVDDSKGPRRLVAWERADLIFDDRTVRIQIDDPLCGSEPRIHVLETESEVVVTADVHPASAPVAGRSCVADPFMHEFKLRSPLGDREIIDGVCRMDAGAEHCGRVS
jgi:hypothetical protein